MATIITPMRLSHIPILAISGIRILLLPKMIAFGGVATGIMNAQDAEIVAGIINMKGCRPVATATAAKIGRIISVVAVFEVTSVRKVIEKQTRAIKRKGVSPANTESLFPRKEARPLTTKPCAKAKPPP